MLIIRRNSVLKLTTRNLSAASLFGFVVLLYNCTGSYYSYYFEEVGGNITARKDSGI